MNIERFDGQADLEGLRNCFGIAKACWPVDEPGLPEWSLGTFTAKWAHGFDTSPQESWLACNDAGEPDGCYLLTLPDRHNVTMAHLVLKVRPVARRAGIGTDLLQHCADRARHADRTRLAAHAWDNSAGAAFAAAVGASSGIAEVTRVLELDDAVHSRLPVLRREAEASASGYALVSWVAPTPDEFLERVALVHAAMADAPRDDGVEPSVWDADRIRRLEKLGADHGVTAYIVAAEQQATGEVAAVTQILTDPGAPGWGFQQITAVLPQHRGRRLGLLVKVGMLDFLSQAAPGIGRILTDNAGANEHMIAINAQLGFEVAGVSRTWYVDLDGAQS